MKVLTNTITANITPALIASLSSRFSKSIFFDIETTGLSPKNSMCWLIGALFFREETPVLIQWFADSPSDEKDILENFFTFLNSYSCVLHFNGTAFDIPFLLERAKLLECSPALTDNLSKCDSLDLFKQIKSCHTLLNLDNYKQKTIEDFLGIHRKDSLSGKKLIALYKSYVLSKDTEAEALLLQHNREDLTGLYAISACASYQQLYDGHFTVTACQYNQTADYEGHSVTELLLTAQTVFPFPKDVSVRTKDAYIRLTGNKILVQIPLSNDKAKLFYADYKNYYYLPLEDCAIHKSVAAYVDKSCRQPARKDTCYTWIDYHTLHTPKEQTHFLNGLLAAIL